MTQTDTTRTTRTTRILITGTPRSGTSAVAALLAENSKFTVFDESGLFASSPARLLELADALERNYVRPSQTEHLSRDPQLLRRIAFDGIEAHVTTPFVVDKRPHDGLDDILHGQPIDKIVVCVRDGREVVESCVHHARTYGAEHRGQLDWWMTADLAAAETVWLGFQQGWRQCPLRYERLTNYTVLELRTAAPEHLVRAQLSAFLGIEIEAAPGFDTSLVRRRGIVNDDDFSAKFKHELSLWGFR